MRPALQEQLRISAEKSCDDAAGAAGATVIIDAE